jgi:aspartyl protease family protein
MKKNHSATFIFGGLGILFIGLLIWRFPSVLNSEDQLASLIWSALLLCGLFPAIRHLGSAQVLKYGGAWAGIFLVLLVGYSYHEELFGIAGKLKDNILPFNATQNEDGSVSFMRSVDGHFQIEAYVNHVPTRFMVDTGATKVALTIPDAKRLGIDVENLSYNEPINTANGLAFGASVRLAEFTVGTITLHDVSASVCQNLSGHSLLGMSFLKRLKAFKIEGDRLTFEAFSS